MTADRRESTTLLRRGDVSIAVTDLGGDGPPLLLLHGLTGTAREMLPTGEGLRDRFRVLLMDQRGHGASTRRPSDVSREAFVADVVAVLETIVPGGRSILVGQSMGAHTAFLTAATRADLVDRVVMLEGHVAGHDDPGEAERLGQYLASWPVPFANEAAARAFLGDDAIVDAWVADLDPASDGLRPRFDADIMQCALAAVHVPRWPQWEALDTPVLAVFAHNSMFTVAEREALIRRRPVTTRADLSTGGHDAHLDAFDEWLHVLRAWLAQSAADAR